MNSHSSSESLWMIHFSICRTPRQIITVQRMVTMDISAMPMGYSAPA